jgi:hypothetical protein
MERARAEYKGDAEKNRPFALEYWWKAVKNQPKWSKAYPWRGDEQENQGKCNRSLYLFKSGGAHILDAHMHGVDALAVAVPLQTPPTCSRRQLSALPLPPGHALSSMLVRRRVVMSSGSLQVCIGVLNSDRMYIIYVIWRTKQAKWAGPENSCSPQGAKTRH